MSVLPGQFADYFFALHGKLPFPWQERLLYRITAQDSSGWPRTLALPTASGKTACIDIALFALACGVANAPRRIFFVVDRRVIVDEAFRRARTIAQALRQPKSAILEQVADALRQDEKTDPLAVFQLRGGVYRDDAWARTPIQPTVICSTVDQIGSRLLFRSYGASPYVWPLHAGLAANDSLLLLDEAHCANPFRQTLDAINRYRDWAAQPIPTPFAHVVLSSTPAVLDEEPFALLDEDRADPELARRLGARKPAKLVECKKERTATDAFAKRLVDEAEELAMRGARRIGIIVNRVATARYVFHLLRTSVHNKALFIGRMRSLDRDALMRQWQPVFRAASERVLEQPCFAVATQCLEVGADLDFDALVTECASLDALRQRFGRLYRLGEPSHSIGELQAHPVAAVVMPAPDISKGKQRLGDPIYGEALASTWAWLSSRAKDQIVDFGIDAMDAHLPDTARERAAFLSGEQLLVPAPDAPVMLPAHVDCWAQTSPRPSPEPEAALFLHGRRTTPPDVHVCWRSDLNDAQISDWQSIVALVPPSSSECMSVPLHVVRRWLKDGNVSATIADIDGPDDTDADDVEERSSPKALIWRGEERTALLCDQSEDMDLRAGDVIVLPENAGGWSFFGAVLENEEGQPIQIDCGDEANLRARVRAMIRLHPALLDRVPESDARLALQALISSDELTDSISTREFKEALESHLRSLAGSLAILPGDEDRRRWNWLQVAAQHLARGFFDTELHPAGGVVLTSRRKLTTREREQLQQGGSVEETDFSTEDDSASFTTQVKLPCHLAGVADFARRFAEGCRVTKELAADIELAASFHDLGKADPRFQAWLRGGLPFQVAQRFDDMLAKSGGAPNARARRLARERSGYPKGGRHELLSVRLVESDSQCLSAAHDPELVLHLIASHHGRCRPFAPVVHDPEHVEVAISIKGLTLQQSSETRMESLDSGVAERFWTLVRRYGWWGLAYLEAIHILADHRCSEAEMLKAGPQA